MSPSRASALAAGPLTVGVDEAGRGCLAGPVVAGAVVLPESCDLPGLDDSKKLSQARREILEPAIKAQAVAWGLGVVWPWDIDRINILQATFWAMARAVRALGAAPAHLVIDGNKVIPSHVLVQVLDRTRAYAEGSDRGRSSANSADQARPTARVPGRARVSECIPGQARLWTLVPPSEGAAADSPGLALPPAPFAGPTQRAVVGGDGLVPAIAAASVLAKVFRDRLMRALDRRYPGYGLAGHKGYGAKAHLAALAALGPCRQHRLTFRGVLPQAEPIRQERACLPGI